jgi:hypothetical protein
MNYNNIKISNKQAEEILFDFYHIKGTAFKLPGETDFNLKYQSIQKIVIF